MVSSELLLQVSSNNLPQLWCSVKSSVYSICRCGNVAAIFELDENLRKNYTIFEAAPNASSMHIQECCPCFSYCRISEESLPRNQFQSIFFNIYEFILSLFICMFIFVFGALPCHKYMQLFHFILITDKLFSTIY